MCGDASAGCNNQCHLRLFLFCRTKDSERICPRLNRSKSGFAFRVLSFGSVFFAPAKKMNPSDMTEDTTSIRATASFARKGAHKLGADDNAKLKNRRIDMQRILAML